MILRAGSFVDNTEVHPKGTVTKRFRCRRRERLLLGRDQFTRARPRTTSTRGLMACRRWVLSGGCGKCTDSEEVYTGPLPLTSCQEDRLGLDYTALCLWRIFFSLAARSCGRNIQRESPGCYYLFWSEVYELIHRVAEHNDLGGHETGGRGPLPTMSADSPLSLALLARTPPPENEIFALRPNGTWRSCCLCFCRRSCRARCAGSCW